MTHSAKSTETRTGHMGKKEIDARLKYEAKLKNEPDDIRILTFMSENQQEIFETIMG